MFKFYFFFLSFCISFCAVAQSSIHKSLDALNVGSVEYVQPKNLFNYKDVVILDAREKEEFEVSHLENAVWAGYSNFDLDTIQSHLPKKESTIVVYCSIGVRSEDIGEKLIRAGYTDVKNLFGGIFLWKNLGYPVFDLSGEETEKIHAYSKEWGLLLTNGTKVYTTKKE
nr:rhodanese-like domain-containing protein [uncultured Allomuricauda sp.]